MVYLLCLPGLARNCCPIVNIIVTVIKNFSIIHVFDILAIAVGSRYSTLTLPTVCIGQRTIVYSSFGAKQTHL